MWGAMFLSLLKMHTQGKFCKDKLQRAKIRNVDSRSVICTPQSSQSISRVIIHMAVCDSWKRKLSPEPAITPKLRTAEGIRAWR